MSDLIFESVTFAVSFLPGHEYLSLAFSTLLWGDDCDDADVRLLSFVTAVGSASEEVGFHWRIGKEEKC